MSMLVWLVAHLSPAPAPVAPAPVLAVTSQVTQLAPAAVTEPSPAVPAPTADSPVCDGAQTPAVDGCAQGQLPEETTGRQYDPAD
jgi:hypothetical protein